MTIFILVLINFYLEIITIIISLYIIFTMNIKLTFFSIILFPFYGFAVKYFYSRLRSLTRDRSQALAEVQGHLHERVQGITVTRSFAIEDYEQKDFEVRNDNFLIKAINHAN